MWKFGVAMKPISVLILFITTIFFITALWVVDVSVIGMRQGLNLINVYGNIVNPIASYHSGLFVAFICFLSMAVIFILGERNYGKN